MEIEYLTLLLEDAFRHENDDLLVPARDFARIELKPWLAQFTQKLDKETDSLFYPAAARLLLSMTSLIAVSG